jgi:hypothetical protein
MPTGWPQLREPRHECGAVERLEFVEVKLSTIRAMIAHVERLLGITE